MTRVLVLEDEPLISMLVQDLLEELGYDVLPPSATVDAALRLIEHNRPDAAILDVSLKGETCASVAKVLTDQQVPFVFATGGDQHGLLQDYPKAPVLPKPFQLEALRSAMSSLGVPDRKD